MTTASNDRRSGPFTGDGTATPLSYDFMILESGHIRVTKSDAGVETVLTLNVDYTLTGVGSAGGGTVVPVAVIPAGVKWVLEGIEPNTQMFAPVATYTTAASIKTGFDGVAAGMDRIAREVQQVQRLANLAVRVGDFSTHYNATPKFPDIASADVGKFLYASDDSPATLALGTSVTGTTVSAAMQPVVQAADLNAGRIALGVAGYYPIAPVELATGTATTGAYATLSISAHTPAGVARFAQLMVTSEVDPSAPGGYCLVSTRSKTETTKDYGTISGINNFSTTVDSRVVRSILVPLNGSEEFEYRIFSLFATNIGWVIDLEGYWL